MKDYLSIVKHEDSLTVCFYIENDKILEIGERMNEVNEEAYMNGENWSAFLDQYLAADHSEILDNMDPDPEAGMYAAYFELTPENENRAKKMVDLIEDLIENESKIFEFLESHGDEIEWD